MFGWDWGPRLPDAGLFRDVTLVSYKHSRIDSVYITQEHHQNEVILDFDIAVELLANNADVKIDVSVISPAGKAFAGVLSAEEDTWKVRIDNPELWWPNGYGAQNLYGLSLEATAGENVSDTQEVRFGIRELSYELMVAEVDKTDPRNIETIDMERVLYTPVHSERPGRPVFDHVNRGRFDRRNQLPSFAEEADKSTISSLPQDDPVGPFIVLRVNGERIFCRGGNWGMDDGMKRSSRERLEPYVKLHKEAGFNIIRNWTGESTQKVFYDLCDEYGMLVWNDFWITTDDTVEPMDVPLFMRNARDVVRRFRNHPSIAVWCPRNEGFAPRELQDSLPIMVAAEDPTRHYHGQSRYLNMDTSGPWNYFKDPSLYYTQNAMGFNTEIGTYAIPTAATLRKFIGEQDQWPINDVWAYHDLHHTSQRFPDFMASVERFGAPQSMEDFSRKAQLVCYDAWRAIMEAWNSRMWNNTTGQILWMSHPAWPSMIWQTYTYDYETPGSYFGAKKACEPLHVQMNLDDDSVVIINTTRRTYRGLTASAEYIDPATGRTVGSRSSKHDAGPNRLVECFVPTAPAGLPALYLVRVKLLSGRDVVSVNDYWRTDGSEEAWLQMNDLQKAQVNINTRKDRVGYRIEVENISGTTAVAVKLNAIERNSGEIILPAYFSDGYFNLLPGEKRTLRLELPHSGDFEVKASGYNI
jgi:hypothetical protein